MYSSNHGRIGALQVAANTMCILPLFCVGQCYGACEESVYKNGDQLHITLYDWGLRVVVCDTQLTSRRRCWLRWLEPLGSHSRCHKTNENSPTLIPAMAVALCLKGRRDF